MREEEMRKQLLDLSRKITAADAIPEMPKPVPFRSNQWLAALAIALVAVVVVLVLVGLSNIA